MSHTVIHNKYHLNTQTLDYHCLTNRPREEKEEGCKNERRMVREGNDENTRQEESDNGEKR